jgi:hypothetical protein
MLQSAMADYYRNVHLYFIKGKAGSELDNTRDLKVDYDALSWRKNFFSKFVLNGYMGYTRNQEKLSPKLQKLLHIVKSRYKDELPKQLMVDFRTQNKPLMKYTNIVQFNTRVIFLFVWLFIGQPWIYFFFDMFVLNPILIYMCNRQEKVSGYFVDKLTNDPTYG